MKLRSRNILTLLQDKTCDYEDRIALGMKSSFGWKELTYKGIGLLSRKLASFLIEELEVKKGERLAILSESKPEYGVCVFASVLSGMVTVPLDVKLTKYELKSIMLDCEPSVIMVSQHYLDTALALKQEISSIKHVIVMDEHSYNDGIKIFMNFRIVIMQNGVTGVQNQQRLLFIPPAQPVLQKVLRYHLEILRHSLKI